MYIYEVEVLGAEYPRLAPVTLLPWRLECLIKFAPTTCLFQNRMIQIGPIPWCFAGMAGVEVD